MAASAILKFYFNGHNSVAIRTIFDTEAENEVLDVVLPSKCTSDKIQDGGDSECDVSKNIHVRLKSGHHIVIFIPVSYTHLTLPTNREV